jgi:hypothetical protein
MEYGMTEALVTAIKANLGALSDLLTRAAEEARQAAAHAEAGERNLAIGTIADFERVLADAAALHAAAVALHRRART